MTIWNDAFLTSPDGVHCRQASCLEQDEVERLVREGYTVELFTVEQE